MQLHILALLAFCQSFLACRPDQATLPESTHTTVLEASIGSLTPLEKTPATASNIVFQSLDGGETWQDISLGLPQDMWARNLVVLENEVVLASENSLYRRSTATPATLWMPDLFLEKRISSLFSLPGGLVFSSYDRGFFRQLPGTGIWAPVYTSLQDKKVLTVLEQPYGVVLVGSDNGIYRSADGGSSWNQVYTQGQVHNLLATNDALLACGVDGVLRSTDGGSHWEPVMTEDGAVQKIGRIGDRVFSISAKAGSWSEISKDPDGIANILRFSADGGKTWQRNDEGLSTTRLLHNFNESVPPVWFITDLKQVGNDLFCSLDAGIFRSSDQGKTWKCVLPTINKASFNLTITGKTIYAVLVTGC